MKYVNIQFVHTNDISKSDIENLFYELTGKKHTAVTTGQSSIADCYTHIQFKAIPTPNLNDQFLNEYIAAWAFFSIGDCVKRIGVSITDINKPSRVYYIHSVDSDNLIKKYQIQTLIETLDLLTL